MKHVTLLLAAMALSACASQSHNRALPTGSAPTAAVAPMEPAARWEIKCTDEHKGTAPRQCSAQVEDERELVSLTVFYVDGQGPYVQGIIDKSPTGDLTFLVNDLGRPFTGAGFGNKMRQWCDEAELPHCSAHGLRKAGAAIAAQNGATPHQLMSVFGWLSLKQAELYTRAATQKRLAGGAMKLLMRDKDET